MIDEFGVEFMEGGCSENYGSVTAVHLLWVQTYTMLFVWVAYLYLFIK
jgi:hypothetical protein